MLESIHSQRKINERKKLCTDYVDVAIIWEQQLTNNEITERTNINNIVNEVRQRRWRFLGYVLCMDRNSLLHAALKWTPPGKRSGWSHWRRTVEEEMKLTGKTWKTVVCSRPYWLELVDTLCSSGSKEN